MKFSILTLIILTSLGSTVFAQDEISGDDYNRAVGFLYDNYNNKKVFNLYIQPNWFPDSTGMWFVHHSPDNKKYLKIAFPDLIQQDLFNHQKLSEILSDSLSRDISANDLPISHLEYKNPAELEITVDAKTYILNTATYALKPSQEDEEINENEKQSPDNRWIAYTKDYNLYIKSTQSEEIKTIEQQRR
jgi:dipeptidyl-peptidase-4